MCYLSNKQNAKMIVERSHKIIMSKDSVILLNSVFVKLCNLHWSGDLEFDKYCLLSKINLKAIQVQQELMVEMLTNQMQLNVSICITLIDMFSLRRKAVKAQQVKLHFWVV